MVVMSHLGIIIYGYNPGVVAVISFFLLSGFTMQSLMQRYYMSYKLVTNFYVDRALRLYPQFLFYAISTLILVKIFNIASPYLADTQALKVFLNFTMLPLGFYMLGLDNCLVIPPAWSLGLELSFYITFPFILLSRSFILMLISSFGIFFLAYLEIINTDYFGYRLLPGVLFIFLAGSVMSYNLKISNSAWFRKIPYVIWGMSVILFTKLYFSINYNTPYSKDVLIGIIIGIPALLALKNLQYSKLDNLAGNLSYGVFLNHFFVIWAITAFRGHPPTSIKSYIALFIISTILSALTFNFVEKPFLNLRRKLRNKCISNAVPEHTATNIVSRKVELEA